ncbi:MAG: CoA transferase [Bacteroidia bacterium]|nr:CoA transferase [Bacteroidia bacterium]
MEMLDDVKILDFSSNVAGPGASAIATDFGANVIKIESVTGDTSRTYAPFIDGKGMTHAWVNRGKKSIVLDLKDPRAIEICKKLAADADVLVEGFRPGVMARLGLGYDDLKEINSKLIYCSISAFGQTGPYADKPGFDIMGQAISGMISVNGEKGGRPIKHGVTIADYFAGPNAYAAIMTALHYQRRTGRGQYIDVSLIQGMIYLNSPIDRLNDGLVIKPNGGHHSALCPFGSFYNDKGEGIIICAPAPKPWACVAKAMERPEFLTDPKYATVNTRAAIQDELIAEIEAWLSTFPDMDAAIKKMEECDVPCCKINTTLDVANDPQVQHMGYIVQAPTQDDITSKDTFLTRGPNAFFSETPGYIHKAPALGQHTRETLEGLGYSKEEIDQMVSEWTPKGFKV